MKPLSCGLLVVLSLYLSAASAQQKPKPAAPVKPTPTKTPTKAPTKAPTKPATPAPKIGTAAKTTPPTPPPNLFSEGTTAFKAGDYKKAEEIFRRAVKLTPQDPALHYYLGRTLKRRADCVGALSAFSAARAVDAEDTLPKELLAAEEIECQVLLTDIPDAPQASAATEARVALEEGQTAYASGDFEAALKALEQAQERRPNDATIYYQRGLVLYALGRHSEAMKSLLTAQRLDPQLGFASPEEYRQALSKAQVRVGATMGAGLHLFRDDFLNTTLQATLEGLQQGDFVLLQPPSDPMTEQLTAFAKEHLTKERRVLFITAPDSADPAEVADALWGMELRYQTPALLVVANAKDTALRASDLPAEQLALLQRRAQSKATPPEKFWEVSVSAKDAYQAQALSKALWTWGGLSLAALLLSALFVSWRRRVERTRAAFSDLRERISTQLLVVAESLAVDRLSLQLAPHPSEELLEAAEHLYFLAQQQLSELPPPRARGLQHWRAEEALFAVEEAGRKSKRVKRQLKSSFGPLTEISSVEKQFGCFFCARPIAGAPGGYRTQVSFRGASQEVLTCRLCANQIAAGAPPAVKMVLRKGRRRHWSQTRAFEPRYDFYAPRIPIEMLSAVEAWSELFGDEGHSAMPEGGTLTAMPALAPAAKGAAKVSLLLTETDASK